MNEAKKNKGLWHNIRAKRKRGERPARPGEKGYPKTLDIGESALRSIIRSHILREWEIGQALMSSPESIIDAVTGFFGDMFGPTEEERLKKTGDAQVIDEYQTFLGTLHMTPEYKMVWENYKKAQRRHASMDRDFDRARDIRHPVGRAFNKLKSKLMMKLDELEETLSPENRDLWKSSVDESRAEFEKIFNDWYLRKITTGRVLAMLDPRGVVESRRRGRKLSEGGEMVAGRDLAQLQTSEFLAALETAHMDLEDAGCQPTSDAYTLTLQAMDDIDAMREDPTYDTRSLIEIGDEVVEAIRSCPQIDRGAAERIAGDIADALTRTQELDRF